MTHSLVTHLAAILLFVLATQSCQPSPGLNGALPQESIEPGSRFAALAPTIVPPGYSRANPWPLAADTLSLANWEVRLLETVRGDDAWRMIQTANMFNEPAGQGWEYLLVRLEIKNRQSDSKPRELSLHVTGRSLVTHFSFDAGVVTPEPQLDTYLAGNEQSEGWKAFRIRQGEEDLMLIVDDLFNADELPRYLALVEGATLAVSAEAINSIPPTEFGIEPSQPVPFGQLATMEEWQVSVREMIVGEQAWQLLFETNQFNAPPEKDMNYLVIRVQVGYIGLDPHGRTIMRYAFRVIDAAGSEYEPAAVVIPDPELFVQLFPGGSADGWIVFLVPDSNDSWILDFDPDRLSAFIENRRYLSLVHSGR